MNGATTLTSSHIFRQTRSRGPEQWARSPSSVLSPVEGFLPPSILYSNFSNPALKMLLALPMLLFCLSLSEGDLSTLVHLQFAVSL